MKKNIVLGKTLVEVFAGESRNGSERKSPIRAIGKRVVVEMELRKPAQGGILLPDNLLRPHDRGFVVSAGAKCHHLTIGDYVLLPRLAGENVVREGKTYAILLEHQVLAKQEGVVP